MKVRRTLPQRKRSLIGAWCFADQYGPEDARTLKLANLTLETARLLLLGGEPFTEDIVMWWNFVARSHDEIVDFRHAWENEAGQFGHVEGYAGLPRRLPAPALPNARIKPRKPPTPTQNPWP